MRRIIAALVFLILVCAGILVFMKRHRTEDVVVLLKPLGRGAVLDPTKIMFVTEYDYLRDQKEHQDRSPKSGLFRRNPGHGA
mgnify:CR=1 FL=1